jgi:hypothetical protein
MELLFDCKIIKTINRGEKIFIVNLNLIINLKTIEIIITSATVVAILATTSIALTLSTQQQAHAFTPDWIPMYSDLVYAPVAASGENVYVTWWTNASTGEWDVFLAISRDNGQTFEDVIRLTNGTGRSFDTRIDAEGENVYVTWLNNKTGVNQIYMRASNDAGETFGDEVQVNNAISSEGKVASPTPRIGHGTPVITSGDNVYMVWFENATGLNRSEVFFRASNDAGETFGDVINLSNSANATSDDPAIAAEGENVYVTFWDDKTGPRKPFVVVSNDAGETFGNPVMLNATATGNNATQTTGE